MEEMNLGRLKMRERERDNGDWAEEMDLKYTKNLNPEAVKYYLTKEGIEGITKKESIRYQINSIDKIEETENDKILVSIKKGMYYRGVRNVPERVLKGDPIDGEFVDSLYHADDVDNIFKERIDRTDVVFSDKIILIGTPHFKNYLNYKNRKSNLRRDIVNCVNQNLNYFTNPVNKDEKGWIIKDCWPYKDIKLTIASRENEPDKQGKNKWSIFLLLQCGEGRSLHENAISL